jgi:two-component system, chemotaxis family, response regulator Rcp1
MKADKAIEILLVEDNPGDARLAQEAIREAEWDNHLNWVSDGTEAMHFLRRQGRYGSAPRPDLILLDLNLPRKDGREVLAEIKADEALRRIPVIVLSTSDADEDVLRAYKLKANSYISKPVQLSDYVRIVKSLREFWFTVVNLPSE